MKQKSRTYNSIFNSAIGIISAIFNVALNFFVRIVIVRALGEEINGLHSLFQNIINIMAVVETSMCTAMIIHLYEPMKHDDIDKLNNIMSFYNKIYRVLAAGFMVVGGIMNLFLKFIVTTDIPMAQVHMYFFIFTLAIAINYLTYTYRVVLFAEQKNRVSSIATLLSEIIFRGGAALLAMLLHSYTFFLICFIVEKLFGNLICRFYVRKEHKGICCTVKNSDNKKLRGEVMTTVKPLFVSRIADIVQNSSQGILISVLLGNIAIVGYYGNYSLVIGSVGILFSQLGASFTSSFGNLATERDPEKMYKAFRKTDFIMSSIGIVMCSGFLVCIQDFISLAFGVHFLLGNLSVLILTLTMLVTLLNIPIISVQNATGRHDVDVKNMIFQALCSVVLGYIGGTFFGMEGLLIGMLVPLVLFTTVIKNIVIQKEVFGKTISETVKYLSYNFLKSFVVLSMVYVSTYFINTDLYLANIFIKGIVALVVSVVMIVIVSLRDSSLKDTVNLVKMFIKK